MIDQLYQLFNNIRRCNDWSILLLRQFADNGQTRYTSCEVNISPAGRVSALINGIIEKYAGSHKPLLEGFTSISDYDGTAQSDVVYRLEATSQLISEQYRGFIAAIADPITDTNPLDFDANAVVYSGSILSDDEERIPIKFISVQNPFTTLKHRFLSSGNMFKEIDGKVLYLKETIDILIYGKVLFFLDMKAEKLFAMERAYKQVSKGIIEEIVGLDIVSDPYAFTTTAQSGFNPRRFLSFDRSRLSALYDPSTKHEKAALFQLSIGPDGKIDTKDKSNAERLIKVLCKKGMYDPFDNIAVEVPASRRW